MKIPMKLECWLRPFIVSIGLLTIVASSALAQEPTASNAGYGTIVGVVTTAAKVPVGGATVTATRAGGGIRSTISGSDGIYTFADVLAGSWSLTISSEGFPDVQLPPLSVIAGKATRRDIAINIPAGAAQGPALAVTTVPAQTAPAQDAVPTVPEALQAPDAAPEVDHETPWADVGYVGWMNGTPRSKAPVFDTKFFTPEIRFDMNYLQSLNHPIDHTIVGSTEEFRSGEFQIEQVSFGGDFHWDNVRARFLSMFGMFATTTPRNDASSAVGQWDLQNAYRYFSEANAGYHFDVNHGLNVRDIARAARLIDAKGGWIGGDAVLVQTGDVVDRGLDSLKIVQDLMRLQREALGAHGQVIALLGNHEAMNVTGDSRYVSAEDYAAFADYRSSRRRDAAYTANKQAIEAAYRQRDPQMTSDAIKQAWTKVTPLGLLEHHAAWRPDGKIGRWIVDNPAIVLLDGNIFVHGGVSPAYTKMTIAEINQKVAAALIATTAAGQAILNDPLGPLWYRGLADETAQSKDASGAPEPTASPGPPPEVQLESLLPAYGAKRIVIGHTPVLTGIAVLYGGRLIRIDTGISSVYGGKISYLEILDGNPIPHTVERSRH